MITRRTRDNVVAAFLGAIIVFGARPAAAQGMALSRFEPSERGSRFFVADSLELGDGRLGRKARVAVGVASAYAYRTRLFGNDREGEETSLVKQAFYVHPGASVTVAPGARFALDVPVAWQTGTDQNLAGHAYQKPPSPSLGDIRASFDLRLGKLGPVTFAGGVMGHLPTGSQEAFTGDDYVRFGGRFAAALEAGSFVVASRVGYMYRREGFVGGVPLGSEVNGVLGAAYARGIWFLGPELWTSTTLDDPFAKRTTPVDVLVGAHATFGDLRAGFATGRSIAPGLGSTYLRVALSFEWVPRPSDQTSDRDHDGVPDESDPCPDVAGSAGGCPPVPAGP